MQGSVYRRGNGWVWQFTVGNRRAGTRKTIRGSALGRRGAYRTKKAAEADLAVALARWGRGDDRMLVRPSDEAVSEYLTGWLEARKPSLKASTFDSYERAIAAWIAPRVGAMPLRDVGPATLTGLYDDLRSHGGRPLRSERIAAAAEGREPVGRPLGDRAVQMCHTIMRMALADAVESGALAASPVDRLPKRARPTYRQAKQSEYHWNAAEARRFLESTRGDRLHALWVLALDTGARRGELAALRWSDVDLDGRVLTIRASRTQTSREVVEGSTKSGKARRVHIAESTVEALQAYRECLVVESMAAGPGWLGDIGEGYVFVNEIGEALRPDAISDRFEQAQAGLDLPRLTFHGLRHTSATLTISAGVGVHVVSERLGHANVSITLDLYSHVLASQGADAADRLAAVINGH